MRLGSHVVLIIALVIGLIGLSGLISIRVLFSGPEDTWICLDNQWVKHGNPEHPAPQTGCGHDLVSETASETASPNTVLITTY